MRDRQTSQHKRLFIKGTNTRLIAYLLLVSIGEEIIDTIFYACQTDPSSPGLMLEDVQRMDCLEIIDHLAGASESNIDTIFKAADTNGDGIVMISEVSEAFQSLALLRKKKKCRYWNYHYSCSYSQTCCEKKCTDVCNCPDPC